MRWYTDGSVTFGGFTVCGSHNMHPPPPAPTPGAPLLQIVDGGNFCQLSAGDTCVSDGQGRYGNNERCTVRALSQVYVTATYYQVEQCCDYLSIGTVQYRGTGNGPSNVLMMAMDTMRWYTDGSVVSGGFVLCASTQMMAAPPPHPSPPPPPPSPRPPGGSSSYSFMWSIIAGPCVITRQPGERGGTCVSDGRGAYGNNERCTIASNVNLYASARQYDMADPNLDYISICNRPPPGRPCRTCAGTPRRRRRRRANPTRAPPTVRIMSTCGRATP